MKHQQQLLCRTNEKYIQILKKVTKTTIIELVQPQLYLVLTNRSRKSSGQDRRTESGITFVDKTKIEI